MGVASTRPPFTLGVLRGPWGWTLLALVWSLALVGIVLKATCGTGYPKLSVALYLTMGWIVLIALRPLYALVPVEGLGWLLAGGIAYTTGVVFFAAQRLRYGHFVWHLFVLGGSTCHVVAVLGWAV